MKNFLINLCYKIISILDYIDYNFVRKKYLIDNYKTIEEISLDNIDILTDTGYENLSALMISKPFEQYIIKLENGYELNCADEHIVFNGNFNEIYVKDLKVGNKIQTDKGLKTVISIKKSSTKISMCDTTVNSINHRFYSNGILSHNSTTTAIYCLWVILFNTDKTGLILSKSGPAAADLLAKIKDMYLFLPYHLKCGTMKWNQSQISFDNNSTIGMESFSPTAGLGKTINFLILDEFAWCPASEVELFYNNIIPTITTISDSNVCIMSTQNGFNLFYKLWKAAIEHRNIYAPFKVDWYQVPQFNMETKTWEKRTEKWKQEMIGILGSEEAFYYQYGTQFSASDKCLVSRECLAKIRDNTILFEPISKIENDPIYDALYINHKEFLYMKPGYSSENFKDGKHFYVVLVDLAEGGGGDYTVFNILEVLDKDNIEQVGYWRSNSVDIEKAALEFWLLACQWFNKENSLISIEWNTYGALFYQILNNLNEPEYDAEESGLYRNNVAPEGLDMFNIVKYKKQSLEDQAQNKYVKYSNYVPGIRFTSGSKSTACSLLKMMFEKGNIILTDIVSAGELENFEDKNGNGTYKAAYGHDDIIMTFCQIPLLKQTGRFKDFIEDMEVYKLGDKINEKSEELDMYSVTQDNPYSIFEDYKDYLPTQFKTYETNPLQNRQIEQIFNPNQKI